MSRASLRAAVVTHFTGVAGLTNLYRSQPKTIPAAAWGTPSGSVAFPYIESESEKRQSFGGDTGGRKRILYTVGLVVRFRSTSDGETAMDQFDALIEALKIRLRTDRTLGSAVFSAGEGDTQGDDDIDVISDLPQTEANVIHIWSVMRFQVVEWVTA